MTRFYVVGDEFWHPWPVVGGSGPVQGFFLASMVKIVGGFKDINPERVRDEGFVFVSHNFTKQHVSFKIDNFGFGAFFPER